MLKFAVSSLLLMTLSLVLNLDAQEAAAEAAKEPNFPELVRKSGRIYWQGYLNQVPDSFVIDPPGVLPTVPAHSGVLPVN